MKKMYFLALAALAMAFSCAKNAAEQIVPEESVGKTVTVTCEFAQPDTKVAIDDSNGKTTWEEGDQISIHGKYFSKSVTVTLAAGDITDAGKTATFTVTLPTTPYPEENPEGYYAVYPASAAISNDSGDHAYHYSTFSTSNLPLMAGYYTAATNKFTFFNLCGIMSFKVSGDYDTYELEAKNGEVLGYGKYAVKITSSEQNFKHSSSAEPLTMISGSVVSDGSTPNLICIPKEVSFAKNSGFVLYLLKDGLRKKKLDYTNSKDDPLVIAHNKYRPLGTGDIISHFTDASTPTHNHGLTGTLKEDLSAGTSANSYIINASDVANADKLFKFKAYKGNSNQNVGAIKSVDVLWETDNTATAVTEGDIVKEVAYDYQSGNSYFEIYLKTPSTLKAGNALIAAKDAGNNVLWSWHIWMPAADIENAKIAATDFAGASYIMDRNLGAINTQTADGASDPLAIGLYYQWGRKDPFPCHSSFSSTTPIALTGQQMVNHSSHVDVDFSIGHPTFYAYIKGLDGQDWNTVRTDNLWENSGKTIYDPCPPTYRVPKRVEGKPMWTGSDTGWDLSIAGRFTYGAFVFPVGGYIDCYSPSFANVNVRGLVWSATVSSANEAYALYDKKGTMVNTTFVKAKAAPVRCVKE